jgi:hypothetical protein
LNNKKPSGVADGIFDTLEAHEITARHAWIADLPHCHKITSVRQCQAETREKVPESQPEISPSPKVTPTRGQ